MEKKPININEADGLTVENIKRIIANPFYCVGKMDETMCVEHEPLITEELWIKAAVKSINESGAEDFLRHLLENLKGNFI